MSADSKDNKDHSYSWGSRFIDRHPVAANIVIILVIGLLGIYAAYLATAIFTKHGQSREVPGVENMSYTQAISKLHDYGFKVDIRDSLYRDDVKPGYVIEQFPKRGAIVKPGRKIFLYINAVHSKEVVLDDDNHPGEFALRGESERSAMAKLEELGFKNIRVVKVLGSNDRVVKVLANGRPVHKMQKVAVNSSITIEVSDGRLYDVQDSLQNLEYMETYREERQSRQVDNSYDDYDRPAARETSSEREEEEQGGQYF